MHEGQFASSHGSRSAVTRSDRILLFEGQKRALAQLVAGMDEGVRWLLLLGPEGIGKSTVLHRLLAELEHTDVDVVVSDGSQAAGAEDLLAVLRGQLQVPGLKAKILGRPVADLLASRRAREKPLVVLMDDAHVLSPPSLMLLAELAAKPSAADPPVFVVLVGRPALEQAALGAWGREAGRRAVQCMLAPLTETEVGQHVERRMRTGAEGALPLSEAAIQRISSYTSGIPELINALCDRVGVSPSARLTGQVSVDAVDEAAEQLGLKASGVLGARGPMLPGRAALVDREDVGRAEERPARRLGARWVALLTGAVLVAGLLAYLGPSLPGDSLDWLDWLFGTWAQVTRSTSGPEDPLPSPRGGSRRDSASTTALPGRTAQGSVATLPPGRQGAERRPANRTEKSAMTERVENAPRPAPLTPSPERVAALIAGARDGQIADLTRLLASGVSPNVRDASGFTPLMLAVVHGHAPAVRALLDSGAQINARNRGGITPTMLAVINERPEVLKLLLERGADVNAQSGAGWSALTFAAWKGDPDLVRVLLSHGGNRNAVDKQGWTPLRYAQMRSLSRGVEGTETGPEALSDLEHGSDLERGRHSEVVPLLQPSEIR
jgi:type II secretory pathway predicted ATPase ExeA